MSSRIHGDQLQLTVTSYTRILNRIKSRTAGSAAIWAAAVKLLGWMSCARRPMWWHEIHSIDSQDQSLRFDAKKFRDHAQDLCGALILELPGKRLTLVHSTARQSVNVPILPDALLIFCSYIVRNEFISLSQVERNLTTLCLQYLTFPSFVSETSDAELENLVRSGQLAFHDYAIANWTGHFLEFVAAGAESAARNAQLVSTQSSTSIQSPTSYSMTALSEFESALEDFTTLYAQEMKEETGEAAQECLAFSDSEYYREIQQIWSLSKQYSTAALEVRNKPCFDSLENALVRGRQIIEDLSTLQDDTASAISGLDEYYGASRFKCPKVTCHWFHVGFDNEKTRKTHVARHERPFRCEVSDCSAADMGFTNSKALEKHVRMFHPSFESQAETFTPLKAVPTKTPYACHLCSKRFTRKINLTSHIRNHNQERPFACAECGKDFTRLNDRRRHERTIHSNRA